MASYGCAIERDWNEADISQRRAIFLDMNIWIDLVDSDNATHTDVRDRLLGLVQAKRCFCPLSTALLIELLTQEADSALRVAALMDELCLGLTFSIDFDVFDREVENYIRCFQAGNYTRLPIHGVLGPVAAFLGSGGSLVSPHEHPATETERKEIATQPSNAISRAGLVDLVRMLADRLPMPKKESRPPLHYAEIRRARFDFTKGNRQRMRSIEENYVVQHLLMPRLQKAWWGLLLADRLRLAKHMESLPWNRHGCRAGPILQHMPAMLSYIEALTIAGYDPTRSNKTTDVMDIQMMVVPLAYAHAFASNDRWMRHLLMKETHLHERNGVTFLGSYSQLTAYLDKIEG